MSEIEMDRKLSLDEISLYKLSSNMVNQIGLPCNTYLIENSSARLIHFDPLLTGIELQQKTLDCSKQFVRMLYEMKLIDLAPAKICQLLILSGGTYYYLRDAFSSHFNSTISTIFLGIKRRFEGNTPIAQLDYENLEATPSENLTLIGDTIGTGATLEKAISHYVKRTKVLGVTVSRIIVFTIAGATVGAKCLAKVEKEILQPLNIDFHVFFSEALFGLEKNNIDLKYYHPDTITSEKTLQNINQPLERLVASRMCAIWDWGERNNSPDIHYRRVISFCDELLNESGALSNNEKEAVLKLKLDAKSIILQRRNLIKAP